MNRLYVVETALTPTGAKADHRLALRAGDIEAFARALAAELGVPGAPPAGELPGDAARWVRRVSDDLRYLDPESGQKRQKPRPAGTTVVVAGDRQPAAVHLLAHAINHHLGNVGKTVFHTAPLAARPVDHAASLAELADDMDRGLVEVLVILGGNPVYNAPADLRFAERMQKAPLRFHLSLYQDETSRQCHWHLPEAHYLEAWSDTRAFDGTASIVQPLIEPLYQGRSAHELLTVLAGRREAPPRTRSCGRTGGSTGRRSGRRPRGDFDDFWQTAVHDGVVPGTAYPLRSVSLKEGWEKHLGPGAAPAEGTGTRVPGRPDDVRRPFRQQRLAPGAAQADHASHLGQRRSHESEDGEGAGRRPGRLRPRRRARRLPSPVVELQLGERTVHGAGLDHARPRRRLRHRLPGLRPAQRRQGRRTARSASTPTPCAPRIVPGSPAA